MLRPRIVFTSETHTGKPVVALAFDFDRGLIEIHTHVSNKNMRLIKNPLDEIFEGPP